MKQLEIKKILAKYIDKRFQQGGLGANGGWNCLSMLVDFYLVQQGKEIPTEFEGFTIENYAEKWNSGEGRDTLLRFLRSLGEKIDRNRALAGDLFIIENEGYMSGSIYLGNGNLLTAFCKGIKVFPLAFYADKVVEVRRCIA